MKIIKKVNIFIALFGLIICSFMLFNNTNISVYAQSLTRLETEENITINQDDYSGYGCNNGYDLKENINEQIENTVPENMSGFGCNSICGASREGGYSADYHSGCRNWQIMPIISPLYKYWIDESTLSSLTDSQKAQFIFNVDKAASEWNSVRIADYSGAIVNLTKQSSNGLDVVPIRYNPSLSDALGLFNPIPLFHQIEIKYYNDYDTIMHEFGHMIGLQDLDMNNNPWTHISLMGYAGDDKLHYQDIQGLAVANDKHIVHDYRRYWIDGGLYKYVCFYCDVTCPEDTALFGGEPLITASTCIHKYEELASAGSRHWHKCTKCYKVIETPFLVMGINNEDGVTLKITGQVDNRSVIEIPREIGGQVVTQIGDYAFTNCAITSVTFQSASNILKIGDSAFSGCTSLGQITIPASVTTLGNGVFANCTNLSRVIFEWNTKLNSLGDNAFENCTSLTGISFPAGITSIGNGVFRGCSSLTNISMSSNITSIGNNAFAYCSGLTSITIPSKVTEIGYNAFQHCSKLSSITIPSTVQWIGGYAFANCTELSSVVFQESCQLTSIGNNAFENCTSLTSIDIPEGIQYIYIETFSNCSAMSSIKIPYSVDDVANHAFAGCTSLTTVYYGGESETDWSNISIGTNNTKLVSAKRYYLKESQPTEYGFFWHYVDSSPQPWPFYGIKYTLIDNQEYEASKGGNIVGTLEIPSTYNGLPVTRIAKWGFANSSNITNIIIPASITVLYGSSFANCPNVQSIKVNTSNTVYMSQGNCIISRKKVELIVGCKNSEIPAGITEIGDYAFQGCSALTEITIPSSVVHIGFSAFENCTGLTSVNIYSSVTEIEACAFYGCIGLTNITIPNSVKIIGDYAFYGMGLTSISIPSSVESIGEEAFGGNPLTEIIAETGNSNYYSEEGVLFGNGGVLIVYPKGKEGVYIVPDGTTEIGNYAFYGCYQLRGIVLPSSVTKIGDYAFVGCDQLEEFIFAEDSGLEYIGYEAFAGCWALEEITIPSSVTYVGALAFATWEEHQKIVVQADVSVLEQWDVDWAVDCYAEIEWDGYNLVATEGLGYILTDNGYEVEVGSSLEHSNGVVIIPAEYEGYPVIGVADNGFAGRSELIKVIFAGNNLIRIGTNAFGGCHNLIAINIPDGVTEIGDNAFYGCHQLQNVRLPRTVERIGDSVFAECHNLKSVTVPGGVVYIEVNALEGTVGYTIYTEIGSNPSEWHFLNNNPECAIFYNCMLSEDGIYVVSIVIQEENYINADPSAPYRDGYVLLGWTTVYGGDVEYTMQEVADGAIDYGTVLYAVWQREV